MRGRQTRGHQTVSGNSGRPTVVVQKGSSNKGSSNSVSEQWSSNSGRQTRGRQTVSVNSGRPKVVVQKGSSNKGSSNSVSEQWSPNRGRQTRGRQTVSVNSGRPTVVSSSRLTAHDLQLRKVISPSFELRFGCSWTLWKAH